MLNAAAFQIHSSALSLAPSDCSLQAVYGHKWKKSITILQGIPDTWDTCLRTIECHSDSINSVAFSLDGSYIASASSDHTIQLWDTVTGAHLKTLRGHSAWVQSVAFSPNGTYMLSGSADETVKLWDTLTGTCLKTLKGHHNTVSSVVFSPNGEHAVSGSDDYKIRV